MFSWFGGSCSCSGTVFAVEVVMALVEVLVVVLPLEDWVLGLWYQR